MIVVHITCVLNPTLHCHNIYIIVCLLKKLRKDRQAHIYRIYYINLLVYHFWLSSLVPVDLSYHLASRFHSSTALLPPTFLVLYVYWQIYCISLCYQLNNTIMYIHSFIIAFKSTEKMGEELGIYTVL